ncbi:MAG: lamin tail domain-containing protein [Candidatus Marinimicrobia bacterium]|nr:lamin tail domain-containing protein [Candidatus Neomarinimicrobiota bacterium]
MYDLDGTDSPNEFVEIYNLSSIDTVNLAGWQIRDRSSTDALHDSGYGLVIPPESYGIIFEGDYNFNTGIYADSIPAGVVLIKVDDSSIGNSLSTSDSLFLISSEGVVQDSIGWTDIAPDGFSIEKVRIELANSPSNWESSQDSLGTPGSINSVEPFTIDGELIADSLTAEPEIVNISETVIIHGYVTNSGRTAISGDVEIWDGEDILESIFISSLNELDTTDFSAVIGPFTSGQKNLDVHFAISNDQDTANNNFTVSFGVRYPVGLFTINEFLPYPESGESEFVELFYHGDNFLSLSGWSIADQNNNPALFGEINVEDQNYIVIGADSALLFSIPDSSLFLTPLSSFPALNNGGDAIRIYDPFNTLIDSLTYSGNWDYDRGQSMEKIFTDLVSADSASWLPAVDANGSTPGLRNSVMPWPYDGAIIFENIKLDPIIPSQTDSIELAIPVVNSGQNALSGDMYIEYNEDELASTVVSIPIPGDTILATLIIPPLPSGENILFLALDVLNDGNITNNADTVHIKVRYPFGTIRLNEFMAKPNNDQTEFIELVSFDAFNLNGWSFSDNNQQMKRISNFTVENGDYIVLGADSSIYPLQNSAAHFVVSEDGWPSLNNSGDAIFLYDLTGSIIDSLRYDSDWPLTDEISTEKLRPEFASFTSANWGLSTDTTGITPGFSNSITLFDLDGALLPDLTWHEPLYPKNDESIFLFATVVNSGVTSFEGSIILAIDGDEYGSSDFSTIEPGDTAIHGLEFGPLISGYHYAEITLDIAGDENNTNDVAGDSILISYDFGDVVLNEFMAVPDSMQSEFVELVSINSVKMDNWSVSDNSMSLKNFSFGDVAEEQFLVLVADSIITEYLPENGNWKIPEGGFPGLNNTSDGIYLYDMTNVIIDSLVYTLDWGIVENRSLEKYRPEFLSSDSSRWAVAVNETGQSPGQANSVYYEQLSKAGQLVLEPNPFSPDGDGFDDLLYIKYKLPFEYGVISIQIFDVIGRTIAVPYWNMYTAQENIFTWDGKRKNGEAARIGVYIIKVKAADQASSKTWEDIQTVVLAKQL